MLRHGDGLGSQPLLEVAEGVVELAEGEADLGPPGLGRALAEVGAERRDEIVAALGEHGPQRQQPTRAPLQGPGVAAAEIPAQPGDGVRDLLGGCGRVGVHGSSQVFRWVRAA
ncbi:hypothetical protein GCM10020000_73670 [Streptomyces olivoverticillatus]